jgi:hypothetical protein
MVSAMCKLYLSPFPFFGSQLPNPTLKLKTMPGLNTTAGLALALST